MKKALKFIGITVLIIFALLLLIPFAFQGRIQDLVKRSINENLNAQVEFSDVNLSFIRSFPRAHVGISDLSITNFEPFKDETLATIKDISFTMSLKELLKASSGQPLVISSIIVDEALITLKTDKFGNVNYDIAKASDDQAETQTESSSGFAFDIEKYAINKSALVYIDEASKMQIDITELNHSGKGIFSAETSELDTYSEANVSFSMDSTNYLNNNSIKLDAVIGLDLNSSKYTFKDNKGFVNNLPIEFDGFVQLLDEGQNIDITFKNPETDFKNFLALVPKAYSKSLDGVQTSGDFKINGIVKGKVTEESIPTIDVSIISNNASFKYPDLPKKVDNIVINTSIKNTTGNVDDTYVDIKTLNFKIDEDVFKSSALIKNITQNMLVNANLDGTINLANLTQAYPVDLENELTGILKGKLNVAFDMNAIETNAYERIKNSGSVNLSGFMFSSEDMLHPVQITQADMTFKPGTVSLNSFNAKTGESDIAVSGTIKNLMGFLLSDNTLKGNFNVSSNVFNISDFMTEEEGGTEDVQSTGDASSLKIPAFLECVVSAKANTVVYDNLNLKNVTGKLYIKDQQAALENMTSNIFDGALSISGDVSTKEDVPTFNFNLDIDNFDIAQSFNGMELLQNIAPIANLFQGKLNTDLKLSGSLNDELSLDLSSVSGNALAELLTTKINSSDSKLLSKLDGELSFINLSELDLKDLKTKLSFANGKVSVQPFDLNYKDIAITVSGAHGFDKTVEYNAVFNVPAKYLGSEVNRLIGKIDDAEVNQISIPVTANITGSLTNPAVKTDLTSGVQNLTQQLIEIEKQKLLNQGKDKVKDLISGVIGSKETKTDSTKTEQSNTVKNVLGTIIKGSTTETKTDTVQTKPTSKNIKDALGGLFGSNKKKATDTVN